VIPTGEDVLIEFNDTWAETVGKVLTGLGLLALLVVMTVVVAGRRSERDASEVS
jgi:hypothetical protein